MKKLTVGLVALCFLCISACGGGGGGNEGTVLNDPSSIFTNVPHTHYVYLGNALTTIKKTADGLSLEVDLPNHPLNRTVDLPSGENSVYRDYGTEIRARAQTALQIDADLNLGGHTGVFNGILTATDTIYLGGLKTGLQHSEFGVWQTDFSFNGTVDGSDEQFSAPGSAIPFMLGDAAKHQSFTPGSDVQTFNGQAVAVAVNLSNPADEHLFLLNGTATLSVDTANLSSGGNLELDFANFYTFHIDSINMGIGNNFSSASAPTITPNGTNTTGIVLSTGDLVSSGMEGYLFGEHAPDEAAGIFGFLAPDAFISGAFGVHR